MRRPSRTSSSTRPTAADAAASRPSVTRRRSARAATSPGGGQAHGTIDRLDDRRAHLGANVGGDRDGAVRGFERAVEVEPGRRDRDAIARSDRRREPPHPLDRLTAARDPAWWHDVEHGEPDDPFPAGRPPEDGSIARRDGDRTSQAKGRQRKPVGQVERVPAAPADARLDRRRPGMQAHSRPIGQGAAQARRGPGRWPRPMRRPSAPSRDAARPRRPPPG